MRLDFFCNDGSPIGVIPKDVYGRGVGGAEIALLTLVEELGKRGHEVWVYNNPREPVKGQVKFARQQDFYDGHHSDVFVLFRSPNPALLEADTDRRVFWSCDQQTVGNYTKDIFPYVDLILTISPFHRKFHVNHWKAKPQNIIWLDLGVRTQDYDQKIERIPGRLIFCSVPDRGLAQLKEAWSLILDQVPGASLVITGDYTLWGTSNPLSHHYRMMFARESQVEYLGNIPRHELVKHQLEAQVLAFPCTYDELFCISAAECQVAGAFPVTSTKGALETTNDWGVKLEGDPRTRPWIESFVGEVVKILRSEQSEQSDLRMRRTNMRDQADARFNVETVVDAWEEWVL
jgi:glycosyltransferase involved in cell wall biosynthesis